LADRVEIVGGDVERGFRALDLPVFDAVISNPPFFDDPAALRAPAPEKSGAWMADGGLAAWTAFCLKAVREGGTITLIHRADRLADILALLAPKAGSFKIRPVAPFADAPAKRVIVRAIKTGKAPAGPAAAAGAARPRGRRGIRRRPRRSCAATRRSAGRRGLYKYRFDEAVRSAWPSDGSFRDAGF
jgi:hypothetical protein